MFRLDDKVLKFKCFIKTNVLKKGQLQPQTI